MNTDVTEHPSFIRAKALDEPWRSRFAHDREQAQDWKRYTRRFELAMRVIAVSTTRIECAWCAYIDAVPGNNHDDEEVEVLRHGCKLGERIARAMFPDFPPELPYAL